MSNNLVSVANTIIPSADERDVRQRAGNAGGAGLEIRPADVRRSLGHSPRTERGREYLAAGQQHNRRPF